MAYTRTICDSSATVFNRMLTGTILLHTVFYNIHTRLVVVQKQYALVDTDAGRGDEYDHSNGNENEPGDFKYWVSQTRRYEVRSP